jgi:hypothetical protein
LTVAAWTRRPAGKIGVHRANVRHALKAMGVPCCAVGRNPFAMTTRANRVGCSPTIRRPMSAPQSCPNSVMSSSASVSIHAATQSTWRW